MTLTELKAMIQKPLVEVLPIMGSSIDMPALCKFKVRVDFVDPTYPTLEYVSKKKYDMNQAENDPTLLMSILETEVIQHKKYHDFITEKQATVDAYLNLEWGS